jgi:hypothetical protein
LEPASELERFHEGLAVVVFLAALLLLAILV